MSYNIHFTGAQQHQFTTRCLGTSGILKPMFATALVRHQGCSCQCTAKDSNQLAFRTNATTV